MASILNTLQNWLGISSPQIPTPVEPEPLNLRPTPVLTGPEPFRPYLAPIITRLIQHAPEAWGADAEVLTTAPPFHGLAAAIHLAYDQHLPLLLSPDALWLCLMQGVAHHIQENAERLRPKIVSHTGKLAISVRRDDFCKGAPNNPWPEVFSVFSKEIKAHIGPRHDALTPCFSTTTTTARAAGDVVLLSAMQSYFKLEFYTLCGIPEVILQGTANDWALLHHRIMALRDLELGWWLDALDPILKRVEAVAAGGRDQALWDTIYKPKDGSGGPYASGWINLLFPYLQRSEGKMYRNPHVQNWQEGMKGSLGGGPTTMGFPNGLSGCPFLWNVLETRYPMMFYGGFVGVTREPKTGAVGAVIGWAVAEDGCKTKV